MFYLIKVFSLELCLVILYMIDIEYGNKCSGTDALSEIKYPNIIYFSRICVTEQLAFKISFGSMLL